MAQLRLTAPPLASSRRRELSLALRAALAPLLTGVKEDWVAVTFLDPGAESTAHVHLDVVTPPLRLRTRRELAGRLTALLAEAYGVEGPDVARITVRFESYDPMTEYALGFRFLGYFTPVEQRIRKSAVPLVRAALILGGAALLVRGLFRGVEQRAKRRRIGNGELRERFAVERDTALFEPAHED